MHVPDADFDDLDQDSQRRIQGKQVVERLKALLPTRLAELAHQHRSKFRGGKALRRALLDPRFLKAIDEYLSLKESSERAYLDWEVRTLRHEAQRSLEAYWRRGSSLSSKATR